jgi:DNA-binding PadR family transcriptional regulator
MSDLEHAVLGVIWLRQPCTAYAVRQAFEQSPTAHWSGSAGAIYPLVRRLEQRRLLRSAARRGDKRATRLYRLTRRGLAELQTWLRPPLPDAPGLMNVDPLRVRVRFWRALSARDRQAAIEEAQAKLRRQLARLAARTRGLRAAGDEFGYLVGRGAALSIRAQLAWLREVRDRLAVIGP